MLSQGWVKAGVNGSFMTQRRCQINRFELSITGQFFPLKVSLRGCTWLNILKQSILILKLRFLKYFCMQEIPPVFVTPVCFLVDWQLVRWHFLRLRFTGNFSFWDTMSAGHNILPRFVRLTLCPLEINWWSYLIQDSQVYYMHFVYKKLLNKNVFMPVNGPFSPHFKGRRGGGASYVRQSLRNSSWNSDLAGVMV